MGGAPIGLYLHIPFCLGKCPYCDFYSRTYSDALADAYTAALLRALAGQPFGPRRVDTVYFGGGTPILLGVKRLSQILASISAAFSLAADAEITLEANPAAALGADLAALRKAGFNRLSLGIQSLDDGELRALGRLHDAATAIQTIEDAAAAGFANTSADLMLAVPGQTEASLTRTLERLSALPVRHISAYLLKLEENTPFWQQRDALSLPEEDASASLYQKAVALLEHHGFFQYEISNFARKGAESRHNRKYWRCEPYLGIGPAAHSFLDGRRFYFPRDLDAFLQADAPFSRTVDDGTGGGWEERLMLGLRLTEGCDLRRFPPGVRDRAARIPDHLLRTEGDRIALTPAGFLLSNTVLAHLLE